MVAFPKSLPPVHGRRLLPKRTPILLACVFGLMLSAGRGAAADETSSEQVWILSTRRLPVCGTQRAVEAQLRYWRLSDQGEWESADEAAFHAEDDPATPTIFHIHGNLTNRDQAVREGDDVLQCLRDGAAGRGFRLVIWSWPADRIAGRRREDIRVKAQRCDPQSFYLARAIDRMNPRVPVAAVGYSFGARIITGAMEILGGGSLAGYALPERENQRRAPLRAVLVASALDCDWLLPNRRNGLALTQLDEALITVNSYDPVLRWYPLMYHLGGPQALGYAGPACCGCLGSGGGKIDLLNVSGAVGKNHAWACYMSASALRTRLAHYAFPQSASSPAPSEDR